MNKNEYKTHLNIEKISINPLLVEGGGGFFRSPSPMVFPGKYFVGAELVYLFLALPGQLFSVSVGILLTILAYPTHQKSRLDPSSPRSRQ